MSRLPLSFAFISCILLSSGYSRYIRDETEFKFGNSYSLILKFGAVNPNTFKSHSQVEIIEVEASALTKVEPGTFSVTPNLTKLEFQATPIDHFMTGVFSNCSNLEKVEFQASPIVDLQNEVFTNLRSLKKLAFQASPFGEMKPDMLRGCENLEEFECEACFLQNLETEAFSGLNSLKKLKLGGNCFKEVSFADFPLLPKLKSIDLVSNPLSSLNVTDIRTKCPVLDTIKISNVTLPSELTQELTNLQIKLEINFSSVVLNCESHS